MQIEETLDGSSPMRRAVRWSWVVLLGIAAGAVTMAATAPAGFAARMAGIAVPADVRLSGTVWHGAADFARGHRATWDSRFWGSVLSGSLLVDLHVAGPQTDLVGQGALNPGKVTLAPFRGQVGWSLLEAVMPGLEIACATTADVDIASAAMDAGTLSATGQVRLAHGVCGRVDGKVTDVPLPALLADIATVPEGITIAITGADAPDVALGSLLVTKDNRLRITVHAAGAAMVPGLPKSGDSEIELPLALFTQ